MVLSLHSCTLRSWRSDDLDSLVEHADNRKIWRNLRDGFPHPYRRSDGREFLRRMRTTRPETTFAIEVDGAAIGAIGFMPGEDVERVSAEVGYWIGERFWGRGIATEALRALTRLAIDGHRQTRLFAVPFAWNVASCRVLEKAGYVLEARLRHSAFKDGELVDQMQYAHIA
ncbi:MAG: GNAT family N-acetyltransferase [Acidobacteria bacterium]|nr:GNAT family N-acetyltransferase [Acidobacteriota bacterium]